MTPEQIASLPFLTRTMLALQPGSQLSLDVDFVAHSMDDLEIKGFTRDGGFTHRFTPVGDSSIENFNFPLADIPIFISASLSPDVSAGSLAHTTIYLRVNDNRVALLCQGLIGGVFGISFPNQLPQTAMQALGATVSLTGANPAAGAEMIETVPDNQVWELLGAMITLVTDGTVANRTVQLVLTHNNGMKLKRAAGTNQTATQTQIYSFIPGGTSGVFATNASQEVAIPIGTILDAGSTIETLTTNLQAGDNFGTPKMWIRRNYLP